ncbi:MAG: hypothetical protein NZ750_09920 [Anaerolineae bacterium]|nr:hypothetical protein [Anaerolineae bacterium]MDW8171938.1 hypothetical protein [Anaerolineae bacterium]
MIDVKASQVLFSSVTARYSLERRAGYQVAYASPSLTAQDVRHLEARLRCFQPAQGQSRQQYFALPSGALALSHSALIFDPDPFVIDPEQRQGAFIAHAYVFSPQVFDEALRADPFVVFDSHYANGRLFIDTVEGLAAELEQPRAERDLNLAQRRVPALPMGWDRDGLMGLFLLASFQQQRLLLKGSPQQIVDMLAFLHYLAQPTLRRDLTFDTCLDSCSQSGLDDLWAVGGSPSDSGRRLTIDLSQPLPLPAAPPVALGYETWLEGALDAWEQYADDVPTMQEVAQAFRAKQPLRYEQAQEASLVMALEVFHREAEEGMRRAWEALLSRRASQAMLDFLGKLAHTRHFGVQRQGLINVLNACAAQRFDDLSIAAQALYDWIVRADPPVLRQERARLAQLASSANHLPLQLVAILYDERRWGFDLRERERQRQAILNELEHRDLLMNVLKDLCGRYDWAAPQRFVAEYSAKKLAYFVANMMRVSDDDLLAVVEALLDHKQYDALAQLDALALRLERSLAAKIYKRLSRHKGLAATNPFFVTVERVAHA